MKQIGYISVVVPTFGPKGVELTKSCVESLRLAHSHLGEESIEIIIVEDSQDIETIKKLDEIAQTNHCILIGQENGGFAKACNRGVKEANGMVVYLVNNDIEFTEPCLQIMADVMNVTSAGVVGCRLLYPSGTVQHGGVVYQQLAPDNPMKVKLPDGGEYIMKVPGYFDHAWRNAPAMHPGPVTMRPGLVTGALFGLSRWAIDAVGLLDERFGFSAEDIDYCLRVIETGRDVMYCGYTSAIHKEGATRGATLEDKIKLAPDVVMKEAKSLEFLFQKWVGVDFTNFSGKAYSV